MRLAGVFNYRNTVARGNEKNGVEVAGAASGFVAMAAC
jgi:hypothetical protein